jgi:hypothetical protein
VDKWPSSEAASDAVKAAQLYSPYASDLIIAYVDSSVATTFPCKPKIDPFGAEVIYRSPCVGPFDWDAERT